jgi:hypothetical protein
MPVESVQMLAGVVARSARLTAAKTPPARVSGLP